MANVGLPQYWLGACRKKRASTLLQRLKPLLDDAVYLKAAGECVGCSMVVIICRRCLSTTLAAPTAIAEVLIKEPTSEESMKLRQSILDTLRLFTVPEDAARLLRAMLQQGEGAGM
jgi:hypothetical protein